MTSNLRREGYHSVNSYFMVVDAEKLIKFLEKAFDAEEISRTSQPDGSISNAEVQIGDSRVMISEARPDWPPMPTHIYLYVEDTDATYLKALEAGANPILDPMDMHYGDRNGGVLDVCGNYWWIATKIKDVTQEEIQEKHDELFED